MTEQPQEQPIVPEQLSGQPEQPLPLPTNKRRKLFIIGGAVLFVIILAGAAFLAGSLMNKQANNNQTGGQITQIQGSGNGGPVTMSKSLMGNMIPAKELPTVQPDVRGIFVLRTGNTFTIGTGNSGITIMGSSSGQITQVTPQASFDGPTYEVVVTKDTLIYKDTTQIDPSVSDLTKVQQTVATGSLDDLNSMTMISIWGKKTGDRYVADVILYTEPMIQVKGGSGGLLK